jgi:hypothetical protein
MGVFTYDGDRGLFVNDTTKPTFELRLDAPHSTTITTEVHLVILMTTCHTGPTKRRGRLGIIIHKDPKGSSSWNFRRVGVFHIRNEEEANVSNWDAKEIVLV